MRRPVSGRLQNFLADHQRVFQGHGVRANHRTRKFERHRAVSERTAGAAVSPRHPKRDHEEQSRSRKQPAKLENFPRLREILVRDAAELDRDDSIRLDINAGVYALDSTPPTPNSKYLSRMSGHHQCEEIKSSASWDIRMSKSVSSWSSPRISWIGIIPEK